MTVIAANITKSCYFSNGVVRPTGRIVISDINEPESIVRHKTLAVGDVVTYQPDQAVRDGDSLVGEFDLDRNGVPSITGAYGSYGVTFQYNGGGDEVEYVAHVDDSAILATFNVRAQDSAGWTVYTPESDSRLIYVDLALGNNSTAGPAGNATDDYTLATLPNVDDWENPGAVNAYATIAAALGQRRENNPDWLLLKRGETYLQTSEIAMVNGRGAGARATMIAYGVGARPIINVTTNATRGIRVFAKSFIDIANLHIQTTIRDPDHGDFIGYAADLGNGTEDGIQIYNGDGGAPISDIQIEGCKIEHFPNNINNTGTSGMNRLIIRRNYIYRAWSQNVRSQGLFTTTCKHLIEENAFRHNGWTQQSSGDGTDPANGQAIVFNHNVYLVGATDTIVRNNIFALGSSIEIKWTSNPGDVAEELSGDYSGSDTVKVSNIAEYKNFYIDGDIGNSVGGNNDFNVASRWEDMRFCNSAYSRIGESAPTNRPIAIGIDMQDWDKGLCAGNVCAQFINTAAQPLLISGHVDSLQIARNFVYDAGIASGTVTDDRGPINFKETVIPVFSNIDLIGNYFQNQNVDGAVIGSFPGVYASNILAQDNKYYSTRAAGEWARVDNVDGSIASWQSLVAETGATDTLTTIVEERDIESYMTSLGQTATLDAFLDQCEITYDKGNWDADYTGAYVFSYFKNGYRES